MLPCPKPQAYPPMSLTCAAAWSYGRRKEADPSAGAEDFTFVRKRSFISSRRLQIS